MKELGQKCCYRSVSKNGDQLNENLGQETIFLATALCTCTPTDKLHSLISHNPSLENPILGKKRFRKKQMENTCKSSGVLKKMLYMYIH